MFPPKNDNEVSLVSLFLFIKSLFIFFVSSPVITSFSLMSDTLLALEASDSVSSLTLSRGGKILFERQWQSPRNAHATLFTPLSELTPLLQEHTPSLILVGSGPGSYSGIRVALAVADGFSLMWDIPVVALCSWEALSLLETREKTSFWAPEAQKELPAKALILADARRGGWVCAHLKESQLEEELFILEQEKLALFLQNAHKDGYQLLSTELPEKTQKLSSPTEISLVAPHSRGLIRAWEAKTEAQKALLLTQIPAPLYVRPPHITPCSKKKPIDNFLVN